MAMTVTSVQGSTVPGAQVFTVNEVTFDNSYASEGEPLTASELGLKKVVFALCQPVTGSENESEFPIADAYYTPATEKIHLLNAKTGKEVASGKNVEKVKALVIAFGSLK